ncbi:unnamed protein product, partial [Iphiclides podalirius]
MMSLRRFFFLFLTVYTTHSVFADSWDTSRAVDYLSQKQEYTSTFFNWNYFNQYHTSSNFNFNNFNQHPTSASVRWNNLNQYPNSASVNRNNFDQHLTSEFADRINFNQHPNSASVNRNNFNQHPNSAFINRNNLNQYPNSASVNRNYFNPYPNSVSVNRNNFNQNTASAFIDRNNVNPNPISASVNRNNVKQNPSIPPALSSISNDRSMKQQLSKEGASISDSDDDPCNYKDLAKPNFNTPGRRISESKCYEYVWEIQNRLYKSKRLDACIAQENAKPNGRRFVISGRNSKDGEFPHMGAVGWRAVKGTWIFLCGSSLISSKFMLTAAHCSQVSSRYAGVANRKPEIVRLGDINIIDVAVNGEKPIVANITRIIVHPQYAPPKKYFDIAIIQLQRDVSFSINILPACLWTNFDTRSLGRRATLTGWGVIETATLKTSPVLQAAEINILSSDVCDSLLKPSCNRLWCGMSENQMCAGNLSGGVDTCQGDSGGPLQVKIPLPYKGVGLLYYIIGVTSFGIGCARANTPGVYTRVSSYIDWIENVVWRSTA